MLLLRFIRLQCSAGFEDGVRSGKRGTLASNGEISETDTESTFSEQMSTSRSTSANREVPSVAEDKSDSRGNSSRSDSNKAAVGSSTRRSLKDVVTNCEKEWFNDTRTKAKDGEVQMQMLLAQMYLAGYGTKQDPQLVSST